MEVLRHVYIAIKKAVVKQMKTEFHLELQSRLNIESCPPSDEYARIPHVLLGLNNGWAKLYYTPETYRFVVRNPGFKSKEASGAVQDDFHVSQEDTEKSNDIEKPIVYQFLKRTGLDEATLTSFELAPLHSVVEARNEKSLGVIVPPVLPLLDCQFLKVKIESVFIESTKSNECGGLLYLYDFRGKCRASESVYFSKTELGFRFVQTGHESVVFEMRSSMDDLYLVCVLVHSNAYLFASAEGSPKKGSTPANIASVPVVLACASYKLSKSGLGSGKFEEPWLNLADPEVFQIPCTPATEITAAPGISVSFHAELVPSDSLGEYCYATDSDRVEKLLRAVSIPQVLGHPRAAIHVYGMQVLFSSPQKADFFSVHAYFCSKTVQDLMKPVGSGVFAPNLASESLMSCGKTWPVHASKKLVFPDCFKISLLEEITKTTHLLFHVIACDKKGQSVCYIAVLPLFTEKGPIQNGEYKIAAYRPGSLKGIDYLSKLKPPGKTVFTVSVELPAIFCVPKAITDFAEAKGQQQLDLFGEVCRLPEDLLQKHYVPISHRLLVTATVESLECFCKLTQQCWNGHVPMIIRSALFYCWDFGELPADFLGKFTSALCTMMAKAADANQIAYADCITFMQEVILMRYAYHREPSDCATSWFQVASQLIHSAVCKHDTDGANTLNKAFNAVVFFFRSLANTQTEEIMSQHLRSLVSVDGEDRLQALHCFFRGLMIFAQSSSLMLQVVKQMPVAPLDKIMFSPFHPFLSILFRAFTDAMSLNQEELTKTACEFFCQLCLPLEAEDPTMRYRCAYALFPLLDLVMTFWGSSIRESSRKHVIPIIMFLIGYTPAQLLHNYFSILYSNTRVRFCEFLVKAMEYVIGWLDPNTQTYLNHQFCEFSQRIIRFLFAVFPCGDNACCEAMIPLVAILVSPYQTPRNYPRIFDIYVKLSRALPRNRALMSVAINCITFNLHIARCFACSSLLLYFQVDFETSGNLVISSVHFFDVFISALLRSPEDQLQRYRTLLLQVQSTAAPLVGEVFAAKLAERMQQVNTTIDVVEKCRNAKHSMPFRCIDSMRMADQYKTFPTHRIRWLENIVQLNKRNGWYASAFVAQMHVCTVVETVVSHFHFPSTNSERPMNLMVTQPMTGSLSLLDKEIIVFPFLTSEANIDFNSLSENFKLIAGEFTLELLVEQLEKAGTLAMEAKLFYEARCVYSMLMRIAKGRRQWECIRRYSDKLSTSFGSMNAMSSFYPDTPLVFYFEDNMVFCRDQGTEVPEGATQVYRLEKWSDGKEFPHCFNVFRSRPSDQQLLTCGNGDKEITLHQYTTKDYLPRFTIFSEVAEVRTVEISLFCYVKMEASRLRELMDLSADDFEKCFPVSYGQLRDVTGNFRIDIERSSERIESLIQAVTDGDASLLVLLRRVAVDENQRHEATQLAEGLRLSAERLMKVYHTCLSFLAKPRNFLDAKWGEMEAFAKEFGLKKMDKGSYEGRGDPLLSSVDYDVF